VTAPRKILIIRLSSLGDILHAIPAYKSLRAAYPAARIDWLVESRMAFLLSVVPGLDNIIEVDTRKAREQLGTLEPWVQLRRVLQKLRSQGYEIALDFQGLLKTGLLSLLSGARTRIGFGPSLVRERPAHWFYNRQISKPTSQQHIVELNMALAKAAGGLQVPWQTDLSIPAKDADQVSGRLEADRLSKFAIINPGGGWPTKRWSAARYGALARRMIAELNLPIIVTTAPGEEGLYGEIAEKCKSRDLHNYQLPFLQLIPLIKKAMLFVGGDTGPFHMASILGVPAICILGPTTPERNGPWTNADEPVFRILPCSFCYKRTCPTQNECMDLPIDMVFAAVVRRLERIQ